ncbi:MAG: sulfatase-like hydrolase/transferase [Planctomycetia bacterium]|nr:sulfatase-like hydrolase/transferase [Planctomycetia bacterium]
MNLLCLAIDRLRPDFLGCYGNTFIATPSIDHLAADGFVFDQVALDSAELPEVYTSLWTGRHALRRLLTGSNDTVRPHDLPAEASRLGWKTALVSDEPRVSGHPLASSFTEHIEVAPETSKRPASAADKTQSAALFAAAAQSLESMSEPFFLWAHSRGMAGAWDAPYKYRERYAAEEDPRPPDFVDPPCETSARDFDPDHLLGVRQAYAGQVTLLDEHLGSLVEALRATGRLERTLIVLLGTRGFPLGLHRRIGADEDDAARSPHDPAASQNRPGPPTEPPWGESTHVPLLLRIPEQSGVPTNLVRGARTQALVQPADFQPTLAAWLRAARSQHDAPTRDIVDLLVAVAVGEKRPRPADGMSLWPLILAREETLRDRAVTSSPAGLVLRTSGWCLRLSPPESPPPGGAQPDAKTLDAKTPGARTIDAWLANPSRLELFVRPDDRHEVNDVTQVCREIIESMTQSLREFAAACRLGDSPSLPPLPPEPQHGP